MDAEVYTNASVIQAMTKMVPVRIDVDKQPLIARKYELTGMPRGFRRPQDPRRAPCPAPRRSGLLGGT